MREVFSKTVSSDRITISINEGTFDTTGIEDQWGDLIVIAQVDLLYVEYPTFYHNFLGIPLVSRL
jgi:hypothetical protein